MTHQEQDKKLTAIDRQIDTWLEAKAEAQRMANSYCLRIQECETELARLGKERSEVATFELL